MKTGDTVRDGQGNSYQVGQLLGRGLWGKSWLVRRETTDSLHVLKVPIGPEDVRADVATPEAVFTTAREVLMETARLYEQGGQPFLPRLEARFTLPDGQPAILLPRYPESLETQLGDGMPVGVLLETLLGLTRTLRLLGAAGSALGGFHGDLRPTNVLVNERGDLFLADLATPALRRGLTRLIQHAPAGQPYLPPEVAEAAGDPPWSVGCDTYALGAMLWRGILAGEPLPPFPRRGLDKAAVVAIKDKLVERMKAEDSNPRFHGRLAERVGVFLSRALSRETSPSPPYRFTRLDELQARLEEIVALIRPQVSSVGKVMADRPATKAWFDTEEAVAFSCTVGCSTGVDAHEEIGVGIAVFDLAKDQRLKELDLGYNVEKHPSGRYRFAFRIGALPPGQYRARVAFAIRDSGQPPATAEHEFEVRAAPGWVPPPEPIAAGALPFSNTNTSPTQLPEPNPTHVPVVEKPVPPPVVSPPVGALPVGASPAPARATPVAAPAGVSPAPLRPVAPVAAPTTTTPRPAPAPASGPRPVAPARPPEEKPERPAEPRRPVIEARKAPEKPPPEEPEEPAFTPPKNWSYEPIPKPAALRDEDEVERPSTPAEPEEDVAPGFVERAFAQLAKDPYVLVMVSLTGVIVLLLVLYLAIRS